MAKDKLSATKEAKALATRSSQRNLERLLQESNAGSPDLARNTGRSAEETPVGPRGVQGNFDTPMEEKRFEYPSLEGESEDDLMIVDQVRGVTPSLEAVLQSIHTSIKKNELKLTGLVDAHEDSEDRMTQKLSDAVDRAMGRIPRLWMGSWIRRWVCSPKRRARGFHQLKQSCRRRTIR